METLVRFMFFFIFMIRAVLVNANNAAYVSESGDLLDEVKKLQSDMKLLQQSEEHQNGLIKKLEHENEYLKDRVDKQDKIINELMIKIISLEEKGQRKEDNNDDDEIDKSSVAEKISDAIEKRRVVLENSDIQITSTPKKIRDIRAAVTDQIAFSSYLTHGQSNLGERQVFKFDGVITNDGNAYDPYSGMFTAPVTGTYMFFVTVTSSQSDVSFRLMVNDVIQAGGVARPFQYNISKDVQGTASVILRLNQADHVWVENHAPGAAVWSSPIFRWITFSGFRIF